jgi:hypothetical protein
MPELTTLDYTVPLEVESERYFNEIRTIQTLKVGLRWIAGTLKAPEGAWEAQTKGKVNLVSFGLDVDGQPGSPQLDMVACFFHWFGVSLCNMVRLVGFVRGLHCGHFRRSDLADPSKFDVIKRSVNTYVQSVKEIRAVLRWRHKVGAHYAITSPQAGDNPATLTMSAVFPVVFVGGRYRVHAMTQTCHDRSTGTSRSEIPEWSVTEVFESLIPRYWPGIQVPIAGD